MAARTMTWWLFVLLMMSDLIIAPKPPNIALVIVDDLAVDAIGAYRSARGSVKTPSTLGLHKLFEHIPTPALDKLAEEGVLFTRAYTAASICSPSRYSLLVGKYPSRSHSAREQSTKHPNAWKVTEGMHISNEQRNTDRVGDGSRVFVYNHFNVWVGTPPKDELTIAHALGESGYVTGMVGKWHLSWRQGDPHACSLTTAEYEEEKQLVSDTAGFDYVDALHTCNIQSSTKKGIRFSHNPEFTLHYAQKFVNDSLLMNKPWFLYMGLTLPHPPNARLALTKFGVKDTPAGPNNFYVSEQSKARREHWTTSVSKQADESVAKAIENGYKGSWEKNSHNSASVVWLDAVVGEWVDWLSQQKLLDKTLLVFTADHGLMGKRTCNEHGIRIPMIMRGPPLLLPRGKQVHQLVALHDLAATFLHMAQTKPPKTSISSSSSSSSSTMSAKPEVSKVEPFLATQGRNAISEGDGVSIWPTLGGQRVHDALFCEIGYDRAVIGLNYKYISRKFDPDRPINSVASHRSTQQFYNLSSDPNELDNMLHGGEFKYQVLSKHPNLPFIFNVLHQRISSHMDSTRLNTPLSEKNVMNLDIEANKMKDYSRISFSNSENVTVVNASLIYFSSDSNSSDISEHASTLLDSDKKALPISAKRDKAAVDWLSVG